MNEKEHRQFLENCLNQEAEKYSKELKLYKQLLDFFESNISEMMENRHINIFGYVLQAKKTRDDAVGEIEKQYAQKLKQVSRSVIRISSLILILVLFHQFVYSPVSYQFCKYNTTASRTYEDKEQCR
jgi:hypothetical protein